MRLRAAERFGDRDRHVVCRAHDDRVDRGLDGDAVAGAQMELGRLLRGGVRRNGDVGCQIDLALSQRLEQEVERHHLGERGRMARAVGIGGLQRGA
jgi:hypothetical protein